MLEPSCIFDFHDIAVWHATMRWRQVEALDASAAEAAVRDLRAVEKRAELEAVALRISGAQGENACHINGLFKQIKEGQKLTVHKEMMVPKHLPVWKRRDFYLYLAVNSCWALSNATDKDARKGQGSLLVHSEDGMSEGSLPMDACKWEVKGGGKLQVRSGLVAAHSAIDGPMNVGCH